MCDRKSLKSKAHLLAFLNFQLHLTFSISKWDVNWFLQTCANSENDTTSSQKLDIGVGWCLSLLMELVFGPCLSSLCVSETLHHNDYFSVHWAAMTPFPLLWPPWPSGMLDMPLPDQNGYCRQTATGGLTAFSHVSGLVEQMHTKPLTSIVLSP